jgi:hypothetical protein
LYKIEVRKLKKRRGPTRAVEPFKKKKKEKKKKWVWNGVH